MQLFFEFMLCMKEIRLCNIKLLFLINSIPTWYKKEYLCVKLFSFGVGQTLRKQKKASDLVLKTISGNERIISGGVITIRVPDGVMNHDGLQAHLSQFRLSISYFVTRDFSAS